MARAWVMRFSWVLFVGVGIGEGSRSNRDDTILPMQLKRWKGFAHLFRPMYAGANMGHPSRQEGFVPWSDLRAGLHMASLPGSREFGTCLTRITKARIDSSIQLDQPAE
jgi:hypothetical protein